MLFFFAVLAVLALVVVLGPSRQVVPRRRVPDDARCEVRGEGPIEHATSYSFAQRLGLGRFRRAPTLAERGYADAVRAAREQAHDAHALPRELAGGTAAAADNQEMTDEIAPSAGGHAPSPVPHGVTPENDRPEPGAGPDAPQVPPDLF